MPIAQVNKLGLIIFAVLCIKVNALAVIDSSEYIPFPDSNAVWGMDCSQGFQGEDQWYQHYWVGSDDTTIGGTVYNKLFFYKENDGIIDDYIGAYRNDTVLKHVYYVDSSDTSEVLLYDFSLQVGDTFWIPYQHFTCFDTIAIVTFIDSVFVGTGYRRRIQSNIAPIVEGLGSQNGLFEYYSGCFEYGCQLRCYTKEDSILWGNESLCNLTTNDIIEAEINPINVAIVPNPITGISILDIEFVETKLVTVYNLLGQKVWLDKINGLSRITFNRSNFKEGWYTFQITGTNDKELYYGKFTVR